MKLSELIVAYGDDKVQFQNLDHSLINLSMNNGVSKITFGTEQPVGFNGPDKMGLVVWLDRDRVKEIMAQKPTPAGAAIVGKTKGSDQGERKP